VKYLGEFSVPEGWVSPNHLLHMHWSERKRRQNCMAEHCIAGMVCQAPDVQARLHLTRPKKRRLRLTARFWSKRHFPDIDNLYGGFKLLIDCLRVQRLRRVKRRLTLVPNKYGVIWDDDDKWLELEADHEKIGPGQPQKNNVLVRVFG